MFECTVYVGTDIVWCELVDIFLCNLENYPILKCFQQCFSKKQRFVPFANTIETSVIQIPLFPVHPSSSLQRDTGTYAVPRAKTKPAGDTIQIIRGPAQRGGSCPLPTMARIICKYWRLSDANRLTIDTSS